MKKLAKKWIPGCLVVMLAATPAALATSINTTINSDDEPLERCEQIKVRFTDDGDPVPTARDEATFKLKRSEAEPLVLNVPEGGGIRVHSWDQDDYSVLACKAAAGQSPEKARRTLESIGLELSGGRLKIDGPENGTWLVYLIVKAPRNAKLELETENGGISLKGVSGSIRARSENGPIELTRCSQQVEARTQNGPIAVHGGNGDFRVMAENGPISVDLSGTTTWDGAGLEARTQNGPLSLNLPGDYKSGIRVEASGHSPMSCKAPECSRAHKSWDDDHRWIEFNGDPRLVRLFTVNGPVAVKSKSKEL